jgi:hypothetical protein
MLRSSRLHMSGILAAGALLGYLAASDGLNLFGKAGAAPQPPQASAQPSQPGGETLPACCDGAARGQLLARLLDVGLHPPLYEDLGRRHIPGKKVRGR